MKTIYNFTAIIIFSVVVYIACLNMGTTIGFWSWSSYNLDGMLVHKTNLFSYTITLFMLGVISASFIIMGSNLSYKLKSKEYEKKLNETNIDNSKDKSKIKSLERKIVTLEKALQDALKRQL